MTAGILRYNEALQFLAAVVLVAGALWGIIWGAIKLWHGKSTEVMAEKFQPIFDDMRSTLSDQNESIATILHEVTLNNGSSVKDGVRRIESIQRDHGLKQAEMILEQEADRQLNQEIAVKIEKIRLDVDTHLGYHAGVREGEAKVR